jgi:hypothetical protein
MNNRFLLSTVAAALVLGTVAAPAQTRRTPDQNDQNQAPPHATQAPQPGQRGGAAAPSQRLPMPPEEQAQKNQPAPPSNAQPNAPQPAPRATTGQGAPAPSRNDAGAAQNNNHAAPQTATQPRQAQQPGAAQPGNTAGAGNAANGGANANASQNANGNANANANGQGNPQGVITLDEQQNTRVTQAIHQANIRPLTNVSFSIAVGTAIPADVELHVLPPALVEVVPQYRGYSFVVVEQEALIIDPGTRAIVAVVPFEMGTANQAPAAAPAPAPSAAPAPAASRAEALPPEPRTKRHAERHRKVDKDRHVIIEERRTTTGAGPRIGDRVPDSAVIEHRPVEVYPDAPPVRRDRGPGLSDIPLIGPLFGPPHED